MCCTLLAANAIGVGQAHIMAQPSTDQLNPLAPVVGRLRLRSSGWVAYARFTMFVLFVAKH